MITLRDFGSFLFVFGDFIDRHPQSPLVPLARRQALCVGIMSYDGHVYFGLIGDYDAMADLESFALDLEGAMAEAVATAPQATRAESGNGAVSVQ